MKRAVYPGSFDPITMGHLDIISRISKMFDEVIILVAESPTKQHLFSAEERKVLVEKSIKQFNPSIKNITVDFSDRLTVDFVRDAGAQFIVRGLRAVIDFEYELTMASMNQKLAPDIETLLVFAKPELYFISSRGVKEIARLKGSLDGLVTTDVITALNKKFK